MLKAIAQMFFSEEKSTESPAKVLGLIVLVVCLLIIAIILLLPPATLDVGSVYQRF